MSEMPAAARPTRRRGTTEEAHEGPVRASAYVCEAASCMSAQSHEITARLGALVDEAGLDDVLVKRVGCLGLCAAGPLVEIPETGQLFERVTPDGVGPILAALREVRPVERAGAAGSVLREAGPRRDGELRSRRPREPRRLHRPRAATRRSGGSSPR